MKALSIFFLSSFISIGLSFAQTPEGFEWPEGEKFLQFEDSTTLQDLLRDTPFQNNMKIYEPDINEMAPMPFAQIDTSTSYPIHIKKYEMVRPEKPEYLKKEFLKEDNK